MKITRRNFVQNLGTAAAITVSVGGIQNVLGNLTVADDKLSSSSKNFFYMKSAQVRSFVGRSFIATSPAGKTAELILFEVNDIDRPTNRALGYSGECYSAIFVSVDNVSLDQDLYTMSSGWMDRFSALLVPTGRRAAEYEMIVNRLTR